MTDLAAAFRRSGLRWTPQRRQILRILSDAEGHLTGGEIVDRWRAIDPEATPSTVYRTLDVLERFGVLAHSHGVDGREEFHMRPDDTHGHLICDVCERRVDLGAGETADFLRALEARHEFKVDLTHLTVVGRCSACATIVTAK